MDSTTLKVHPDRTGHEKTVHRPAASPAGMDTKIHLSSWGLVRPISEEEERQPWEHRRDTRMDTERSSVSLRTGRPRFQRSETTGRDGFMTR